MAIDRHAASRALAKAIAYMTYRQTQTWKTSAPERVSGSWRIRRHDGELVGWYASRELAQRAIDTSGWLQ